MHELGGGPFNYGRFFSGSGCSQCVTLERGLVTLSFVFLTWRAPDSAGVR